MFLLLSYLLSALHLFVISSVFFFSFFFFTSSKSISSNSTNPAKSYPIIGSAFAMYSNRHRRHQWLYDLVSSTPTATYVLQRAFGISQILTANPSNVQHILKTQFSNYPKGQFSYTNLSDFLGSGIFNADGANWKFQRQISSHEFNTKSLRKFVETVVETELSQRLLPTLQSSCAENSVLDMQDILQRFAFDNICRIAFGFDPEYLSRSLPQTRFAVAFEDASIISSKRFGALSPVVWKVKKLFDVGSERRLREAIAEVRDFAKEVIKRKKEELNENSTLQSYDLLSRILNSGTKTDDDFVADMVISFILAGRDTTSAALTWFFWLISKNSGVEEELMNEIREKSEAPMYDEVKELVYVHASLCESMRLYPPVPADTKEAACDDVLPDGTVVKKGTRVTYLPYSMGRMESLWGEDWAKFRPERWLEKDSVSGRRSFVGRDPYEYPVFQAGPRVCLGKEMAFLQMKLVVAGVLRRFRIVPVMDEGCEPAFVSYLTSKMKGGFLVRIEERPVDCGMSKN